MPLVVLISLSSPIMSCPPPHSSSLPFFPTLLYIYIYFFSRLALLFHSFQLCYRYKKFTHFLSWKLLISFGHTTLRKRKMYDNFYEIFLKLVLLFFFFPPLSEEVVRWLVGSWSFHFPFLLLSLNIFCFLNQFETIPNTLKGRGEL